jgi:hypothetical protein
MAQPQFEYVFVDLPLSLESGSAQSFISPWLPNHLVFSVRARCLTEPIPLLVHAPHPPAHGQSQVRLFGNTNKRWANVRPSTLSSLF